jgi:UDP-N-acetylglucosamine 2-epimerase (non-hydrolysing)
MIKVLTVFGTRPEAIKMAPVIRALEARRDHIQNLVCVTAQHREILDQVLDFFSVRPAYDLNLMTKGQSPSDVASRVLDRLSPVLLEERPDWVLVQGDTTTTMAAALAAAHHGFRVAHIEAGLRTFDKTQPFPEEINRVLATSVADLHFAPTCSARYNLLNEGIDERCIHVTGNPGIDALYHTLATLNGKPKNDPLEGIPLGSRIILVTAHRRENLGLPLESICRAVVEIAKRYRENLHIVLPVHPNTRVSKTVHTLLGDTPGIHLLEPLDYRTLIYVLRECDFVLTDSGGIQEEAPSMGKPVLVMREVTERPEGIFTGNARLVGTNYARIVEESSRLLDNLDHITKRIGPVDLYGDGSASQRIVAALAGEPVEEWIPERHTAN